MTTTSSEWLALAERARKEPMPETVELMIDMPHVQAAICETMAVMAAKNEAKAAQAKEQENG